jgi:hypothetical protein
VPVADMAFNAAGGLRYAQSAVLLVHAMAEFAFEDRLRPLVSPKGAANE